MRNLEFFNHYSIYDMAKININDTCTIAQNHCQCFELLSNEEKNILENRKVEVKFNRGEIIAKQGVFATHVMFLCEGLVKVYLEDDEETLILKIIGPGSLIGLNSLSNNDTFQYTASSYQHAKVWLYEIDAFKRVVRENGMFAIKIIQFMAENSNQINNRFFCMMHHQSFGKLADLLLCLAGSVFKKTTFELLLTRKELAELAGLSTESVIRLLKDFQKNNLIKIKGKVFTILDEDGLRKICKIG